MARQRHELDDLEAQIDDARAKLADGYVPGTYFWEKQLAWLQLAAAEARQRVTEADRGETPMPRDLTESTSSGPSPSRPTPAPAPA